MALFILIPNSSKVIDRFGRFVITFKSTALAQAFVDTEGKDYNAFDIEFIAPATDEDRAAAGVMLDDGITSPDGEKFVQSADKVKLSKILIRIRAELADLRPHIDLSKLKL